MDRFTILLISALCIVSIGAGILGAGTPHNYAGDPYLAKGLRAKSAKTVPFPTSPRAFKSSSTTTH